jgi:acetoin utilization protein AcuC
MLDRDVAPDTRLPTEWTGPVLKLAPTAELPMTMSDGKDTSFTPWEPGGDEPGDLAIRDTRHAVFPLHGLDPDDPRD